MVTVTWPEPHTSAQSCACTPRPLPPSRSRSRSPWAPLATLEGVARPNAQRARVSCIAVLNFLTGLEPVTPLINVHKNSKRSRRGYRLRKARSAAALLALVCSSACGDPGEDVARDQDASAAVADQSDASTGGGMSAGDSGANTGAAGGRDAGSDAGTANATGGRDASAASDAGATRDAGRDAGDAALGRDAGDARVDSGRASDASSADASSATDCDWSEPPADVAAWINESWNAQLGSNIKNRKAWNLDNVMLNKGQLNLCVRWGATTAVPDMVKQNLAATIERWFNDWFKALGNYGCFPYGNGIAVKITGWAVRPGQQALLGQIDPAVSIYTETDNEGEPKCPDACSSFVHWDHKFPSCQGGDANHHDYWLWFDDKLPGSGNAAAVGGDWGLRMPVGTFLNAFANKSFGIVEHEMGHGFGFQDYYDWTGGKPNGGSLMIVQSSSSQSPTTGDTWLLRRTWKEMKSLRGW
jgi:hypothetical protein